MEQTTAVDSVRSRLQEKTQRAIVVSVSAPATAQADVSNQVGELLASIERAAEAGSWEVTAEYPDMLPSDICRIAEECKRQYFDVMFVVSHGHATITASWYKSNEV